MNVSIPLHEYIPLILPELQEICHAYLSETDIAVSYGRILPLHYLTYCYEHRLPTPFQCNFELDDRLVAEVQAGISPKPLTFIQVENWLTAAITSGSSFDPRRAVEHVDPGASSPLS